ncbi:hypothetical protein ACLMJK_007087 [Lecanora helva]
MSSSLEEIYAGTGKGASAGSYTPAIEYVESYSTTTVFTNPESSLVAIHGLNPTGTKNHAWTTWEDESSGSLWLRDRIPYKQPEVRIMLYQYNSSPVFGISQKRFTDEANHLLERLYLRRGTSQCTSLSHKDHEWILQRLESRCQNPHRYSVTQSHQDAYQWIWETGSLSAGFGDWLNNKTRFFWISGKPGAGKSTLMRYLSESEKANKLLSEDFDRVIFVQYYFYELGTVQESDFGSLLCVILRQLLSGFFESERSAYLKVYSRLKPLLGALPASSTVLPVEELKSILREAITHCKQPWRLVLFIDGLDECKGDYGDQLDFLISWVQSGSLFRISTKACLASRHEIEIELRLSQFPNCKIHNFTSTDIAFYVRSELVKAWDLMAAQPHSAPAQYDEFLVQEVLTKAEGVFVWVKIVVSQLAQGIEEEQGPDQILELLYSFPEGLENLYQRIIEKIDKKFWPFCINSLRILLARTNFSWQRERMLNFTAAIQDPASAISCKASHEDGFSTEDGGLSRQRCAQEKRRLLRSCKSLITIENSDDIFTDKINVLHRIVWEYVINGAILERMLEKVDKSALLKIHESSMAMRLRLLKIYPSLDLALDRGYNMEVDETEISSHCWRLTSEIMKEDIQLDEVQSEDVCLQSLQRRHAQAWEIGYEFSVIMNRIALAEKDTGCAQTPYVEELDRVLSTCDPNWTSTPFAGSDWQWSTDLLSLAIREELFYYVDQQLRLKGTGILHRSQRRPPLLYIYTESGSNQYMIRMAHLLLQNGANPLEIYDSQTVWSFFVFRFFLGPSNVHSTILKLMLEYGADATQRLNLATPFSNFWGQSYQGLTTFHIILDLRGGKHESEKD